MPYIKPEDRKLYDNLINELGTDLYASYQDKNIAGDINYIVTRLLNTAYNIKDKPSYAKINEIVGVLDCIKMEFYRRIAVPYENKKIDENGDV